MHCTELSTLQLALEQLVVVVVMVVMVVMVKLVVQVVEVEEEYYTALSDFQILLE